MKKASEAPPHALLEGEAADEHQVVRREEVSQRHVVLLLLLSLRLLLLLGRRAAAAAAVEGILGHEAQLRPDGEVAHGDEDAHVPRSEARHAPRSPRCSRFVFGRDDHEDGPREDLPHGARCVRRPLL